MKKEQGFATRAIHAGQEPDPTTGAVMTPIYATSTYVQESPGKHKGYDYARSINPTRLAYEKCIADLESGIRGFAFASGLAAMATALELLDSGGTVDIGGDARAIAHRDEDIALDMHDGVSSLEIGEPRHRIGVRIGRLGLRYRRRLGRLVRVGDFPSRGHMRRHRGLRRFPAQSENVPE